MSSQPNDGAAILAGAHRIAPLLRERADEVEAARRLTKPVVEALRGSGVFRMSMPRSWGGPEVEMLRQIEILEVLSRADASAGWCAMIGSDSGFYSAFLEDSVGRELYPDLDLVTAGWVQPAGRLEVVDGGYRLSGRWPFGSGVTHADVICGGALVMEGGVPRTGPDGQLEQRIALLPASQAEVHDTWYTTGLCGSGSHDYSIDDVFVPAGRAYVPGESHRDGTLYRWPGAFLANFLGVPLGVAADALDTAIGVLDGKMLMPQEIRARDDGRVRVAVASARALVGSARSYVYDTVGRFWAVLEAGDQPSLAHRAALAGCFGHIVTSCRDAVELLADAVGTAAVRRDSPLERNLRDLITVGQHIVAKPLMREWAGGLWFGQPSPMPFV